MKMIKKLFLGLLMAGATLTANAQFEAGTKYVSTGLSGLGLSYGKKAGFAFGIDANVGYFVADAVMLKAGVSYDHTKETDDFSASLGARYYIRQNGLFLGSGLGYTHLTKNVNDLEVPLEVGYCFYLNRHVSVEPSAYYNISINDFADGSKIGLRVGLGFYF